MVRRLLLATAVAGVILAAPMAEGPTAPAIAAEPIEPVLDQPIVDLRSGETAQVLADIPFALVGLTWEPSDPGLAPVEVRVREASQEWSEWVTLDVAETPTEPGTTETLTSRPATETLWVEWADAVEVRPLVGDAAGTPRLELIDPGVAAQDATLTPGPRAGSAVAAPSQPPIVTREQWGADESLRTCTPQAAESLRAATIHHTVGSNDYASSDSPAIIRGIYAFHTRSRGWCDIGYNFLVDRFGTIFQGRFGGVDRAVIGAHTGGFNTGTVGVSLMGTFTAVAPTDAARESAARLLAWLLGVAGRDPTGNVQLTSAGNSKFPKGSVATVPTINGHRDLDATECPGNVGYTILPSLRTRVSELMGASVNASTAEPGPAVTSWGGGRVDVLTRASDGSLRHQWRLTAGDSWSSWIPLGGATATTPAISSWVGRLDAFVRGADGALWYATSQGKWSGWKPLGGSLTSAPATVSWGPGRIDVIARGADGALWHLPYDNRWLTWRPLGAPLGGQLAAGPGITSRAWGSLDIVVQAADGAAWRKSWNGGWSGWSSLGGSLVGEPAIVAPSSTEVLVLARGTDDALWERRLTSPGAESWRPLGGRLVSGVTASRSDVGSLVVASKGTDNRAWYRERSPSSSWGAWGVVDAAAVFRQLASWVDTLDYGALNPAAAVAEMQARGVRTLYLGTARYNSPQDLLDPARIDQWLEAAHSRGMRVVGWYVPDYSDLDRDVRRTLAVAQYISPSGQRFDGVGVDIEYPLNPPQGASAWNSAVAVHLQRVKAATQLPLVAIPLPPLLMSAWSDPARWATFPWAEIGRQADAVAPMAYWTSFTPARLCPTNDQFCAYRYARDNTTQARSLTGGLPVHILGGVGDVATTTEVADYVQGAVDGGAAGGSLYDYRVTDAADWPYLARLNGL